MKPGLQTFIGVLALWSLAHGSACAEPPGPLQATQQVQRGPIHLQLEAVTGKIFSWQSGYDAITQMPSVPVRQYIDEWRLERLRQRAAAEGIAIRIVAESSSGPGADNDLAPQGACPIPSSFTVWQDAGEIHGNQFAYSSNAAAGDTTQWATAIVNTSRFAAKPTHGAIALLFRDHLHGLGTIFGNNSESSEGCPGMPFTTQLEAFSYWLPAAASEGPLFQARVFGNSCGAPMSDGVDYRFVVHANTSQDVAYQVSARAEGEWKAITPWIANNPTTPKWQWHVSPAYFDSAARGIAVRLFPTHPPSADPANDWTISFSQFDCGWLNGKD